MAELAVGSGKGINGALFKIFFGGRSITTYFPLRILEERTAIAEADFAAAHKLAAFLTLYRMEVNFKFISPDGRIDFTDPGIVAICGPKSSKIVASALARDTALSFENDGMIYGIRDYVDSRVWKSRRDVENENSDIGYLARNETGPGSGNRFLSIAGIHAEGSAIIVEHLCNYKRIREIHKKTKGSLFSSVIGGTYQRNPLSIEFSQLLTLHIREESCDVTNEVAFVEEDNKS